MGRGVPKWVEWGGGWGGVTSQPRLHLLIRYSSQHGAGVTIKPKEATAGGGRGRWEVGEGGEGGGSGRGYNKEDSDSSY